MKRFWIVVCWAVVAVCVLAVSIGQAAAANVCDAWVTDDGAVHIPEVNVNGAIYWATLQLAPSQNGAIMLKASDYGPVAQPQCANSQRTFYVASEGAQRAFIPTVQYAGAAYWVLLELVPSTDGLLWFKVTGYDHGGDWSGEAGALFATMQIEVVQASDLQMTVRGHSPLGFEGEITITLTPNQPAASPSFTYSQPTEGTDQFQLTYTVPSSDLPPEVAGRLQAAAALNASSDAEKESTVGVVIKGSLKEGGKQTLEHIAELRWAEKGAEVVQALGGLLDVFEAWVTVPKQQEIYAELDRLEECAKHPAIPYFSPEDQQKSLDQLADIRSEIKQHTGMRFLTMMTNTAAGLTPKPIGLAVAAVTSYVDHGLEELTDAELDDARKAGFCGKEKKEVWHGTFDGTVMNVFKTCKGAWTLKVTAEVTFEWYPLSFAFLLKTGNLRAGVSPSSLGPCPATANEDPDFWETFIVSPSSVTVPMTGDDLTFYLSRSGHYRLDIGSPGAYFQVDKEDCNHQDGTCSTVVYDSATDLGVDYAGLLRAEGDALDPNVIEYHNTFTLWGQRYVQHWRLTRE